MSRKLSFWLLVAALLPLVAHAQDEKRCKVEPWQFASKQTVPVSISMPNDGKPCNVKKITFQGGSEATYSVSKPASNGDVEIKENKAFYTPKAGFAGTDKFTLDVAGNNPFARPSARNGQLEVTVAVEGAR